MAIAFMKVNGRSSGGAVNASISTAGSGTLSLFTLRGIFLGWDEAEYYKFSEVRL